MEIRHIWHACSNATMPQSTVRRITRGWSVLNARMLRAFAWAVVQVQDYGLGIPRADVPHIFERYHRGQNVALIDGEGLGLASVRRLTELHGGSVEVRSKLGLGSTFTVKLPLSPSTHQECIDEIHPKLVTTVATDTVVRAASLTIVDRGVSVESGQAPGFADLAPGA